MGGRLDGLKPISTYNLNINSCSTIARGKVSDLLWPISTSTSITYTITSVIMIIILDSIKRPMSTSSITWRNVNNFIIRNFITVMTLVGIISGIMRPIYYNSITTHSEKTCSTDMVGPTLLVWWLTPVNESRWHLSIKSVRFQVSTVLGTGRRQGSG